MKKGGLAELQGAWAVATLEIDGRTMPAGAAQIVVKGDRFNTTGMGATYRGTMRVNTASTPHTLDMVFTAGPERGNVNRGIFEVEGDAWKLCLNMSGGERPTRFATQPGTGLALETLRRGPATRTKAAPETSVTFEPAPELEGDWQLVSMVTSGQALPASLAKSGKRVAKGNTVTVTMGGKTVMRARFSVDGSSRPSTIDYLLPDGQTQHGIYELSGTSLRVVFSAPGQARPADFSTASGDGKILTLWKKKG